MLRLFALSAGLMIALWSFSEGAAASDTCQRSVGGRCKTGQSSPPTKSTSGAVTHKKVQAPAKGNHKGRNEYTAAQREKMMERAREICRTQFGAPSRVYRIDYKKNQVWCVPPAY